MVEVPRDAYTVTCTRLTLDDGRRIFVRTKWFKSSFYVTALDFPHSWSCSVSKQDVEERAFRWEMNGEEYLIQSRLYLEEDVSGSMYSLNPLRSGAMRLSWNTRVGMKYDEPKVVLILHKDNDTMALVSEFMNVLMDSTLILQRHLSRRSNQAHQPCIQILAPEKVRSSMSHRGLSREDVCGGMDGLDIKFEFQNSLLSYETDSRVSTPTHPSNLVAPESRVSQCETRAPGLERPSKLQNSETHNPGTYRNSEKAVLNHDRDAPFPDGPNPLGDHGRESVRQLKFMSSGFHGLGESKREQLQAEMKRPRATDHRSEDGEPQMTDGYEYYSERADSSQLKRGFSVDVLDKPIDRGVQLKQERAGLLHEHENLEAKPCTQTRCTNVDHLCSTSRPSPPVASEYLRKAPTCDKKVISLEPSKLGTEGSGGCGWMATTSGNCGGHMESESFRPVDAKRHDIASEGPKRIITLSDSEEEDRPCNDRKELLHKGISCPVEDRSDKPENGTTIHAFIETVGPRPAGDSVIPIHKSKIMATSPKVLTPNTLGESKDSAEPNAWKVKEEHNRSRLEAQDGSRQMRSRKRKETGDVDNVKIDVEGKITKQNGSFSEEQDVTPEGSPLQNKKRLDTQFLKSTVISAFVEVESERQSEQNPVNQTGDLSDGRCAVTTKYESRSQREPINHAGYHRNDNLASSLSTESRFRKWDAWISEARSPVTSWEVPTENRGSCQMADQQTETHVVNTISPNSSKYLDTPTSLKTIGRDFEYLDVSLSNSDHLQSPQEDLNINPPSEVNSFKKQSQEDLAGSVVEQPETSYTSEMVTNKKRILSEDGPQLDRIKEERREHIQIVKDRDSDSMEELTLDFGRNDGLKVANERQESQKEKGVEGKKEPGRKGRPPAVNKCNAGKTQSNKLCHNVSRSNSSKRSFSKERAARSIERPSRVTSLHHSLSVSGSVMNPRVDVDQELQSDVPDSDYYCFDDDRTKEHIQPNQVWALYDTVDSMPRTLILIKEVSTSGPFSVTANWLQPYMASKKNEQLKSNQFPVSLGKFEEIKESTVVKVLNCFSHKMDYTLKNDNRIDIYPQVGEIWALPSGLLNGDCSGMDKWGKAQEESKFRLVVILSECGEDQAPQIQVLRKRTGFRTLWEPGYNPGVPPVTVMKRLSHKVPAYKLTEKDYPDMNGTDCWDIDAAAVPACQNNVT